MRKEKTDLTKEKLASEKETEKAFTQADIDAAVENARAEWEARRNEAERLAGMSASDREKEENRKEREALAKEREELNREKLLNEAQKQLHASGAPEGFAKMVCGKDADETKANIDAFLAEWAAAVMSAVDEKLKGRAPKSGGAGAATGAMRDVISRSVRRGF